MISTIDIERLIAEKKREIEQEKLLLGLVSPSNVIKDNKENETPSPKKKVKFEERVLSERNDATDDAKERDRRTETSLEPLPADLDRYIRRYIGLPVMLKAGEYSPNNPLVRGERTPGDALLGLGEYERRRDTLRRHHQQQYREYLDQQAKKKQEAKEQAEQERRDREEKDRIWEERERERLRLERGRYSPERRRASCTPVIASVPFSKVNTAVQVDNVSKPLSVAVQTDDNEMFQMDSSRWSKLTLAERELSPRTVCPDDMQERRRSYTDFEERGPRRAGRDQLAALRHSHTPSIFDADAIQMRNLQAEKEAAERRQYYQQELKNQILEQQRIREERKTREKLLELAETRRLEEQLRVLRAAHQREATRQHALRAQIKENATDYEKKRTELQKEIDFEQQKLFRVTHPDITQHPNKQQTLNKQHVPNKQPYSTNIPTNSIFSENYDVDSYLRRNLNFRKLTDSSAERRETSRNDSIDSELRIDNKQTNNRCTATIETDERNFADRSRSIEKDAIPVIKHSPLPQTREEPPKLSAAMRKVDDKWKVPAVQRNVLKSVPNDEGTNVNILTQLGSIRRQLQLEQLKLDRMLDKGDTD